MTIAIDVRGLTKRFGEFTAVDDISFAVQERETLGLLGPNGAGKSTLVRMLTTLVVPTAGTATVEGSDIVRDADAVRRAIGVIPQALTSDPDLSVEENLLVFARLYGVPRERRKRLIGELLDAVQLSEWRDKPVKQLSGGMRRRVEIARGLVHEPRIFFLDEPTTGLDPVSRAGVWEMLQRIKSQRDLTVLMTTHYMDEADQLCDRVAIIDHGRLMALNSPLSLKAAISGRSAVEASFANAPADWRHRLEGLPAADTVSGDGNVFRIGSSSGPATMEALVALTRESGVTIRSLAVQSTTLDDVFVHFTGRELRDALQEPSAADRTRFGLR